MKMLYGCPFEKNGTKKNCSRNNFCSVFYVLKSKKKFEEIQKIFKIFIFENLLHKKGLKGGISIDADSGPPAPRYVF